MSKLSQLKQEAYQAGKKRDWVRAVSIYEKILELDKNNPTLINELGDLCLKTGNTSRGVKHFLGAASKYRQSGLLNNAVAIYKKILRYDAENQNAHWYLSESRASQGLLVEGEQHALIFLSERESISGDIKEIFLKRCGKLFELYSESLPIQENLLQIFRMWGLTLEAGRSQILVGCLHAVAGNQEKAERLVTEALGQMPDLANYPEHARWKEMSGQESPTAEVSGFDSVSLGDPFAASNRPETVQPSPQKPDDWGLSSKEDEAPAQFGDVSFGEVESPSDPVVAPEQAAVPEPAIEAAVPPVVPVDHDPEPHGSDDEGCFNLDLGEDSSFDDLIAQATAGMPKATPEVESFAGLDGISDVQDPLSEGVDKGTSSDSQGSALDQLLSESGENGPQETGREVETISQEIGAQVGGSASDDDPSSLYEMGMVYLEMGLHDQACTSFQKASCHSDFSIRALEMWGITLLRMEKTSEAIAVLTDGLDIPKEGSREYLGLLYHIARANEQAENNEEAQRIFAMIHGQEPNFLDVSRRLVKNGLCL